MRSDRDPPGGPDRGRTHAWLGREQTIYDPLALRAVLARKPGALRNGAPFKDWVLPAGLERVRRKFGASPDGVARWSTSSPRS